MPRVIAEQAAFKAAIADPSKILLLISGAKGTKAERVYEKTEAMTFAPWEAVYFIENLTELDYLEGTHAQDWFDGAQGVYAVLRVSDGQIKKGPILKLMRKRKPDPPRIQRAFSSLPRPSVNNV